MSNVLHSANKAHGEIWREKGGGGVNRSRKAGKEGRKEGRDDRKMRGGRKREKIEESN